MGAERIIAILFILIHIKNMTKFKITKILSKNKFVCLSSLLLTTSIISPLASCGSDGSTNDIGGFDKEFGFDAQLIID